jgi:autotransporter-associated beta strand protein
MAAANWIEAWRRAVGSGKPKKPVRRFRLGVEPLENRINPTTFIWNHGGADANWSTGANWVGGVAPTAADTDAVIVFNTVDPNSVMDIVGMDVAQLDFDSGSNVTLTLNTNLILDGAGAAVNIEDDFTSTNVIAGPGSLVLTNANAVIEQDIFPGFLQISAPFSGNQGFTKTGVGTLILSTTVANTYTGTTTIADGVLQLNTDTLNRGLSSNIVVGDGVGAAGSAILQLGPTDNFELPSTTTLTINSDGRVRVPSGAIDGVASLNVDGGDLNIAGIFQVQSGGIVTSDGAAGSTIDGPGTLSFLGLLPRFDVADGPGTTDLLVSTSLTEVDFPANLVKSGTGTLEFAMTAPNTLTGATIIQDGVLLLNSTTSDAALSGTIVIGDNIGAAGSAVLRLVNSSQIADTAGIQVNSDGLLDVTATASETVSSLNLDTGGGFVIATGGAFSVLPAAPADTIDLTGGVLTFNRTGPLVPIGQSVTLIDNLGTNPITGTFAGLPEGATLTANGQEFTISYVGGDGNDVVLTPASPPPPAPVVLAASGDNLGNVVVFNANTNVQYLKFRPFDTDASQYIGQMSIALGDVNGDGVPDLILGTRGKRAGKVKVFDGASIIAGIVPHPTDTIFVGFPLSPDGSAAHNPYNQAVTVASADVNGDGIKDIIVATRTANSSINNSVLPATVLAYAGANGAITGSILGSFHPFGTAKDGVYVTAGDTTGDGHAEVTVSSSTRSLVKIYQFSGGTFSQLGGDISPFGAIPFVSANGDGQIRAVNVGGSATVDFEVGLLDTSTGAVNLQLLDGTGSVIDSYTNGTGASFFAIDAVDLAADNNGQVMLARVTAAGGTSIDLLDPATGAGNGTLDGLLTLSGKATLAGS